MKKDKLEKIQIRNSTKKFLVFTAQGSVCANIAHTAADGKNYSIWFYSLNFIISISYQVNSMRTTQFRQRTTQTLVNSGDDCLQPDRKQKSNLWLACWQKKNYVQNK